MVTCCYRLYVLSPTRIHSKLTYLQVCSHTYNNIDTVCVQFFSESDKFIKGDKMIIVMVTVSVGGNQTYKYNNLCTLLTENMQMIVIKAMTL